MSVKIYGSSDDLIEVDGDICEEFNWETWARHTIKFLAFSDGTLLNVTYGFDGIWRFNLLKKGSATFSKIKGNLKTGTDEVTLSGAKIAWAVLGDKLPLCIK